MDVRRGQEGVDAGPRGAGHGLPGPLDVPGKGAAERGDDRLAALAGHGLHGGEVIFGGHGEAGLDDIHAQGLQLACHQQLLVQVHAAAGGLLSIAEGGVEDGDPLTAHGGLLHRPGPEGSPKDPPVQPINTFNFFYDYISNT